MAAFDGLGEPHAWPQAAGHTNARASPSGQRSHVEGAPLHRARLRPSEEQIGQLTRSIDLNRAETRIPLANLA